ncbi:MAG TPA: hypothetical protein VN915_12685 [Elusimicrobiota bacterium]|nr:hypothetical protein [Elusimicrobiota bacterium]
MRFARLVLPLLLALPARAAALRHRLYIAPDEIADGNSRAMAKLLVERIHRECDLADAPSSGDTVLGDDAQPIMMVDARVLRAIAQDGFLNQHQAGRTGGQSRESDRFEAEQELAMMRLPWGSKSFALLPKYAVVDIHKPGLGSFRLPTRYGDVAIIFKPEVWDRATWTYADSLDFSQKSGRFDSGGAGNPVLAHTIHYRRKKEDRNRCGNYCEAQIWGKLTLDDVAYAMVRDSEPVPDVLVRAGIPVYGYSISESSSAVLDPGRTAQYVRGARRTGEAKLDYFLPLAEMRIEHQLPLFAASERPWNDFKPQLLSALNAPPGALLINAIAFAAEHRDDPDVAARLAALRRAPESVATEWLERLDKKNLCSPR